MLLLPGGLGFLYVFCVYLLLALVLFQKGPYF